MATRWVAVGMIALVGCGRGRATEDKPAEMALGSAAVQRSPMLEQFAASAAIPVMFPTEPLVDGIATDDEPEVGQFTYSGGGSCTATLIEPTVALTAAHCIGYAARYKDGTYGVLVLDGTQRVVRQLRAYGGEPGADDLALLVLDGSCQKDVRPAVISSSVPGASDRIDVYGFGCTTRAQLCGDSGPGGGHKQVVHGTYGVTRMLCPGDSGGPVMVDGKVAAVASGVNCFNDARTDVFAAPQRIASEAAGLAHKFPCADAAADPTPIR